MHGVQKNRVPAEDAAEGATERGGGKLSRQHGGQMRKNPWPPGVELSRDLVCVPDAQGRPLSYTVVVEK